MDHLAATEVEPHVVDVAADLPVEDQVTRLGLREGLARTVIIKLNGGLGTGMGLERAKSLLTVKDGLTFLEIIAHQSRTADVPLLLMNSFSTDPETQLALATHPELGDQSSVPLSFLQGQVPKISVDSLAPIDWRADPAKTWCPPGHGDLLR